ncbi:MAG: hypothetical protein LBC65_02660 [Oscillospiraceae bacterium]|nr:hypothetical protein [Oscillospiraceae bacterium]
MKRLMAVLPVLIAVLGSCVAADAAPTADVAEPTDTAFETPAATPTADAAKHFYADSLAELFDGIEKSGELGYIYRTAVMRDLDGDGELEVAAVCNVGKGGFLDPIQVVVFDYEGGKRLTALFESNAINVPTVLLSDSRLIFSDGQSYLYSDIALTYSNGGFSEDILRNESYATEGEDENGDPIWTTDVYRNGNPIDRAEFDALRAEYLLDNELLYCLSPGTDPAEMYGNFIDIIDPPEIAVHELLPDETDAILALTADSDIGAISAVPSAAK